VSEHRSAEIPELHEVDCPPELKDEIEAAMGRYPEVRSASIPALWAVQRQYGWCSPEGIRQASAVMGISPAHLESVASFYDLFRLEPAGRHEILVCTNLSCWMRGADELLTRFCEATGTDEEKARHEGSSSSDGEFFVSAFQCMGACDIAPMAAIDGCYSGPIDLGEVDTAVGQMRSGAEPLPEKSILLRPAAGGREPEPDERVTEAY
jgi:NADH:ubiquinone oxidoreductase subunit E